MVIPIPVFAVQSVLNLKPNIVSNLFCSDHVCYRIREIPLEFQIILRNQKGSRSPSKIAFEREIIDLTERTQSCMHVEESKFDLFFLFYF